jgi:hypothetical protein
MSDANAIQKALRRRWPNAFRDGFRVGAGDHPAGEREPGGYPKSFHQWPLDRRNAWWAGANAGYCKRKRDEAANE